MQTPTKNKKTQTQVNLYELASENSDCLLSVAVACATTRLRTCSLAWSAVPAWARIRMGTQNYNKRIQARINILGSQLSPNSINLVTV